MESTSPCYSLIFNGELLPRVRRERALEQVAQLTNLTPEELQERLFSIKPVIIQQLDHPVLARNYYAAFTEAGLVVRLVPYEESHDDIHNAGLAFSHYAPIARQEYAPNYLLEDPSATFTQTAPEEISGKQLYQIVFHGHLKSGMARERVIDNICHLTNTSKEQVVEQIFSVVPVILCETPDHAEATCYRTEFNAAGLVVALREAQDRDDDLPRSRLRIRYGFQPQLVGVTQCM